MKSIVRQRDPLAMSQKLARLCERLHKPEWRQYGATVLTGKLAGVGLTLLIMAAATGLFFSKVYAADSTVAAASIVNPVNTAWTLIAAFLVFGMQVGFTMLEAGFCRSRETVNVLMECIVDTCLCGILFYAIGFAFMFSHGNGFIGYHWFFLQGAPDTYETSGVAFLAFCIFQFAFADTCSNCRDRNRQSGAQSNQSKVNRCHVILVSLIRKSKRKIGQCACASWGASSSSWCPDISAMYEHARSAKINACTVSVNAWKSIHGT